EREEFLVAGVILFCRTRRYLGAQAALDIERLRALAPDLDPAEVERHLAQIVRICRGDPEAGPIGRWPPAERFHWLVAPRSTVIQTSPVHTGLCPDPEAALTRLFDTLVRRSTSSR